MTQPVSKPIRFFQITDTHLFNNDSGRICGINTTAALREVLSQVKNIRPRPQFFLLTGDISQDGTRESYQKIKKILTPFHLPVYLLPGNHDHPARMKQVLAKGAIRFERDLLLGSWRIVLLDSARPPQPGGLIRRSEIMRLQNTLRHENRRHVLVSLHHNPISVGSKWMDRMMVKNWKEFDRIIRRNPQVRGVLFGHIHQEFYKQKNGIPYFGTPSTCVQFVPRAEKMGVDRSRPGFRWVELYSDGRIKTGVVRVKRFFQRPDYHCKGY